MESELESFSAYEPEIPEPAKKTSEEQIEANHKTFRGLNTTHRSIDPSNWGVEILKTIKLRPGNLVVRITRVNVPDSCSIFIFSEQSEIITSRVVRDLIKTETFYLSKLNKEDYRVTTLFDVVHDPLNSDKLS